MEATAAVSMREMRKLSDRQLMEMAQGEDERKVTRAFGVLAVRYNNRMLRRAFKILQDVELAEDAV